MPLPQPTPRTQSAERTLRNCSTSYCLTWSIYLGYKVTAFVIFYPDCRHFPMELFIPYVTGLWQTSFMHDTQTPSHFSHIVYRWLTKPAHECARWMVETPFCCSVRCFKNMFFPTSYQKSVKSNLISCPEMIQIDILNNFFPQRQRTVEYATDGYKKKILKDYHIFQYFSHLHIICHFFSFFFFGVFLGGGGAGRWKFSRYFQKEIILLEVL